MLVFRCWVKAIALIEIALWFARLLEEEHQLELHYHLDVVSKVGRN